MAKKPKTQPTEQETNMSEDTAAQTQNAEAGAAPAAAANDERYKMVTLKDGSSMKRIDYIRKRWQEGTARGAIAKELSELAGKKVPYQIVFAATKGVPGGPAKSAPAEEVQS